MDKDLINENLRIEISQLKEENKELKRENSKLKLLEIENESLLKECVELRNRIEEMLDNQLS